MDYVQAALAAGWRLDPHINKWRHPQSSAVYCNTPRWARYACEDHDISDDIEAKGARAPDATCAHCGRPINVLTQDSTLELIPMRRYHTACYHEARDDLEAQRALAVLEQARDDDR